MSIEIKAPTFPESIADGTVAEWHKAPGDTAKRDDLLVEIETDKVVLEVVAPSDGTLLDIVKPEGEIVLSEEVIATFEAGAVSAGAAPPSSAQATTDPGIAASPATAVATEVDLALVSPAARKLADENGISLSVVTGTGKGGRVTKSDVQDAIADPEKSAPASVASSGSAAAESPAPPAASASLPSVAVGTGSEREERRVPMTRMRATIARRLVEVQQNTATLTTFNEVDMGPVMALRSKYKEQFQERHNGTRLGFMSFFVKASVEALKRHPAVNASVDGDDVVYHGYYDVGVAVGTERGLVIPVVRDADALGMAQIESSINDYAAKAREGKLALEDMAGGTFTITNGGVFGSLLSTPILNAPQTAILGMHKIQQRPMVMPNGDIEARPMMYLALSYDHRLIDGQGAVTFLIAIKDLLEDPARILLEL